jgi:hypothetical protein
MINLISLPTARKTILTARPLPFWLKMSGMAKGWGSALLFNHSFIEAAAHSTALSQTITRLNAWRTGSSYGLASRTLLPSQRGLSGGLPVFSWCAGLDRVQLQVPLTRPSESTTVDRGRQQ